MIREAEKVLFLMAVPLRERGGGKWPAIMKKIHFFNYKKIPTAIKPYMNFPLLLW